MALTLVGMTAKDLLRRKLFDQMLGKLERAKDPEPVDQLLHAIKMTGVPGVYASLASDVVDAPKYGEPALVALAGPTASHVYRWMTRSADEWIPASIPFVSAFPHAKAGLRSFLHEDLGLGAKASEKSNRSFIKPVNF